MKLWIIAGVVVVFVLFIASFASIGLVTESSRSQIQPSAIDLGPSSFETLPFETVPPTAVVVREPEECFSSSASTCRDATNAAISAFASSAVPTTLGSPSLIYAEYVEWPDSCLGVEQRDVVCLQAITPGYRVFLLAPGTPVAHYLEYHTDLAGNAILFLTTETPPDVSPLF